jgi:outer membrane protein OmpU
MYVQHPSFGTIELGQDDGVAANMSVYYRAAWGTGGADGDYDEIVRGGSAVGGAVKLVGGDMSLGDSTKISYYSPRFSGFDFGLSYQLTNDETDDARSHRQIKNGGTTGQESAIQMALRYSGKFNDVGVKAGLSYAAITAKETRAASVNTQAFEDPSGYQAGIELTMAGWTVGGGYINWSDVLRSHDTPVFAAKGAPVDDATSINLGVHYKMGPWTIGANYLAEESEGTAAVAANEQNEAYSVGFRYQLAPGLRLIGELVLFDHQGETAAPNDTNDGSMLLVGTQLSF